MIRGMCAAACLIAGPAALASMTYTFDSDGQGWGTVNDARDLTWDGTIGNGGPGALRARDQVGGDIWFFAAPNVELGDRSSLYGNAIGWDILGITGNQTSASVGADIMLTGNGQQIGLDLSVLPVVGQWTSWSGLVDASAGWQTVTSFGGSTLDGVSVDEATIRSVLSDLTGIYIRGEFTNGSDATAIDNVSIVPAPGAAALLGLGGLAALRRRR